MTCDELREEMELHSLGLSVDPERAEIQEHLRRDCDVCRRNLRQALAVNAAFLYDTPGEPPAPALRRRILSSVGFPQRKRGWIAALTLAAASLFAGIIWLGAQRQQLQTQLAAAREAESQRSADLQRVRNALDILNLPGTRQVVFGEGQPQPPKGRVFVHRDRGVLLLAGNLPPLGEDKTYQFWIIPKGAAPRPAGLFRADASGNAMHFVEGRIDSAGAAVAISVEPASGSPAPTTTPIVVAPLAD